MTVWAVVLAFLGAANPFRRRGCLSVLDQWQVLLGATAALVGYTLLALAGASLRDALDVSTPNLRVAAGLVLLVVGLHAVVAPLAPASPPVASRTGWLVPVLFPVLLRPDLALVAFAADRSSGVVTIVFSAAIALAAVTIWWLRFPPRSRSATSAGAAGNFDGGNHAHRGLERSMGAVLGVGTVVAAVRLMLDGVFAL